MTRKQNIKIIFQQAKGIVSCLCKMILRYVMLYFAFIRLTAAQKGYAAALLYLAPTLGIVLFFVIGGVGLAFMGGAIGLGAFAFIAIFAGLLRWIGLEIDAAKRKKN